MTKSIYQPLQIHHNEDLAHFCAPPGLPPLDPATLAGQRADAHWLLLAPKTDEVVARCSLWWRSPPPYPGHRLGLIGHYAIGEAGAASQLLDLACRQLAGQGCTMAIGPMDGNTWQRYRLLTERGQEPVFFLEPDNPDEWPGHFIHHGFTALAHYISALNPELSRSELDLSRVASRAAGRGIHLRSLSLDRFEEELRQVYRLSLASFQANFLYTPIGEADFLAQYQPIRPYLRPELVLFAEREGQAVGFIFALPDLLQAQRGQPVDTIIVKTVAVHPAQQAAGLGHLLVARCQEIAHHLGYRRAIHALMHETNDSRRISRRNEAQTIRRYTLFAKRL